MRPWRALADSYRVETVEDCVTETQTGFQRRQLEGQIDGWEPRVPLRAVRAVGNRECAELAVRVTDNVLDVSERHDVDHLETGVLSRIYRQGR